MYCEIARVLRPAERVDGINRGGVYVAYSLKNRTRQLGTEFNVSQLTRVHPLPSEDRSSSSAPALWLHVAYSSRNDPETICAKSHLEPTSTGLPISGLSEVSTDHSVCDQESSIHDQTLSTPASNIELPSWALGPVQELDL